MGGRWTSRWRVLAVSLGISVALHLGLLYALQALPARSGPSSPRYVEMQVVRQPPPERVVPLEEPPPPRPRPAPRPKPRPKPRPAPVVHEDPVVAPRPVPNTMAPANLDLVPEPRRINPVAGLSAASFVPGEGTSGPVFGAGNTLMGRPDDTMARPDQVEPYSRPVAMADVETEPRLVATPDPVEVFGADYPAEAKAQGIQGVVRVKVLIDQKGHVVKVRAVKGPPLLKEAAEALAMRFRYEPATVGGRPVSVWWYEAIPFRITN